MDAIVHETGAAPRAGTAIIVGNRDLRRLREIVERHADGVDADVARGLVSVLAPLGTAILGAAAGETVLVERPHGDAGEVRIRAALGDRGAA